MLKMSSLLGVISKRVDILEVCVGRQPTVYGLSERRTHAIPILRILIDPFWLTHQNGFVTNQNGMGSVLESDRVR